MYKYEVFVFDEPMHNEIIETEEELIEGEEYVRGINADRSNGFQVLRRMFSNADKIRSMSNDELMNFFCNETKNIAEMGTNELWDWLNSQV